MLNARIEFRGKGSRWRREVCSWKRVQAAGAFYGGRKQSSEAEHCITSIFELRRLHEGYRGHAQLHLHKQDFAITIRQLRWNGTSIFGDPRNQDTESEWRQTPPHIGRRFLLVMQTRSEYRIKSPSEVGFQYVTLEKGFRLNLPQGEERSLLISCEVKFGSGLLIHHPAHSPLTTHIILIDFSLFNGFVEFCKISRSLSGEQN